MPAPSDRIQVLLSCRSKSPRGYSQFAIVENASHPGYTGSRLVFTPVSNPLTLYCDHFDHGADHSWAWASYKATIDSDVTSDYDGELAAGSYCCCEIVLSDPPSSAYSNRSFWRLWQFYPVRRDCKRRCVQILQSKTLRRLESGGATHHPKSAKRSTFCHKVG